LRYPTSAKTIKHDAKVAADKRAAIVKAAPEHETSAAQDSARSTVHPALLFDQARWANCVSGQRPRALDHRRRHIHLIFAQVFDEHGEARGIGGFLAVRDEARGW